MPMFDPKSIIFSHIQASAGYVARYAEAWPPDRITEAVELALEQEDPDIADRARRGLERRLVNIRKALDLAERHANVDELSPVEELEAASADMAEAYALYRNALIDIGLVQSPTRP